MVSLDLYKPEFTSVIRTLSDILEERDRVRKQYKDEGSHPMVTVISDRGAENQRKNPLLSTWQELNRDALQYWRDLGLTPAGFAKLNDGVATAKPQSSLDKVLWELENSK